MCELVLKNVLILNISYKFEFILINVNKYLLENIINASLIDLSWLLLIINLSEMIWFYRKFLLVQNLLIFKRQKG